MSSQERNSHLRQPEESARAPAHSRYDAVIIGSGPNGLAAAITIAETGRSVVVLEAADTFGGGTRSAELTRPGFVHDVCSAVHALAMVSPLFRRLPLEDHGLQWIFPDAPLAHPLPVDAAVICERSVEATAEGLGRDGKAYRRLFAPLLRDVDKIIPQLLGPLRWPRHPLSMARFGLKGMRSAVSFARRRFRNPAARALFAGHAAHSILPLEKSFTAAVGLMLSLTAHAGGWPVARGGSQRIANALVAHLRSLGGELVAGFPVNNLRAAPEARAYLFDTTPQALARIAADRLPPSFCEKLERFRFGPGAYKLDWALDGPIPWRSEACRRAATVHVGGTLDEIAASERAAWSSKASDHPFVLVAQQSLFDPARAPEGKHVGWGYCHVPHASNEDMTTRIEEQVERFAPGFRELILDRHVLTPAGFEEHNPNYIGGDITGGVMDFAQLFARPTARLVPYTTPSSKIYLCSASTPPGAGVHGMCGYWAARAALRRALRH